MLLPNLQGINWREQQPGYLAGIVAASVSKTGHIAAVGGTAVIPAVVNYIEGYANGAKSINPDAVVTVTYVSGAPDTAAFNDPAGGQAIAQQLLAQDPDIDVMFQVAGKTGNGVLQAACDASIYRHRRGRRPVHLHSGDGRLHDRQRREEADQERRRCHRAHRGRRRTRAASCAWASIPRTWASRPSTISRTSSPTRRRDALAAAKAALADGSLQACEAQEGSGFCVQTLGL